MQNKSTKHTTISFSRILVLGLLAIATSSCLLSTKQSELQDVPEDVLMSEFFLGCWASIEAYDDEGQENDHKFMLLVMDENTLDFVWFNSEGFFQDHTISEYWFIDVNEIFIDNKRILGGEYWLLERDGQDLIAYCTSDNSTITITFTREVCR